MEKLFFKKVRNYRIGYHVGLLPTIIATISQEPITMQFYLGSNRSYSTRTVSDLEKTYVKKYCDDHNKTFYVHSSLICNLAKNENQASLEHLEKELEFVNNLPGKIVVHCGKVGTLAGIHRSINYLHLRPDKKILLENAAGQGTEMGKSVDEIRMIFEGLDRSNIGLCIDTQHTFASGVCDFSSPESVDKLFEDYLDFDIRLIHLNDSKTLFSSMVDRHENIGDGFIWTSSKKSLIRLINRCEEKNIDMVLETPNCENDYRRLKLNF